MHGNVRDEAVESQRGDKEQTSEGGRLWRGLPPSMARTPAPLEIPPDYESTSPDGNSPIPQSAVERALAIESNKPFKVSISANLPYLPNMYQLLININPIYQYIAYCGPKMAHSGSPPLPSTLIHRSPASLSVSTPRDPPPLSPRLHRRSSTSSSRPRSPLSAARSTLWSLNTPTDP